MSEHTQGRLEFVELEQHSDIDASYEISSAETLELSAHNLTYYPAAPSKADARRLVACWNACLGVPLEWLEAGLPGCVQGLREERDEFATENDKLRDALARKVTSETLINELRIRDGAVYAGFEGGVAHLLADSLAEQFVDQGATNYIEMHLRSDKTGPLMVTMQRVLGKTPHVLRREAESQRDELLAAAKEAAAQIRACDYTPARSTLLQAIAKAEAGK